MSPVFPVGPMSPVGPVPGIIEEMEIFVHDVPLYTSVSPPIKYEYKTGSLDI
jgi:hypothetical protein